jgi:hypothetical protein
MAHIGFSGFPANGVAPMTTGGGGQAGDPMTAFEEYFGPPSRPVHVNPYELFSRQNMALPDAYLGRNDYLVNIIITTIKEEEMWAGRIALPFRIADSNYEIKWDEIHFDNQLLGPVPEEGVSRLVTQRTSSRKDHYVRYGLAFQLEHGFMNTDKGKMSYVNNLKQIRNATLDTIYLGVLRAYLSCKTVGQVLVELYGQSPTHAQIRKTLGEELENWACVQKSANALQMLDIRMKRRMRKMGVVPDMWIFPEGMKTYITNVRRENFDYFIKGPEGPKMFQSGVSDGGSQLDVAMDCVIFEAKQFDIPESPEPIDLLCRNQSIGEYVVMQNHLRGFTDWANYSSRMRDIIVYNEDRDSWSTLGIDQCLHYCMMFGDADDHSPGHGHKRPRTDDDDDRMITHFSNDSGDMFLDDDGRPAQYLGDVKEHYLVPRAVSDFASCIFQRIMMRKADDFNIISALSEGIKFCQEISDYSKFKELFSSTVPVISTSNAAGTVFIMDAAFDFPTDESYKKFKDTNPMNGLLGHATLPGLKKVASITIQEYQKHAKIAADLIKATDILFEELQCVGNSIYMKSFYQQPWLKDKDNKNTFFQNIIFQPLRQFSTERTGTTEKNGGSLDAVSPNPKLEPLTVEINATLNGQIKPTVSSDDALAIFKENFKENLIIDADINEPSQQALLELESNRFVTCLRKLNLVRELSIQGIAAFLALLKYARDDLIKHVDEPKIDVVDFYKCLRFIFESTDALNFVKRTNILFDAVKDVTVKVGDTYLVENMLEKVKSADPGGCLTFTAAAGAGGEKRTQLGFFYDESNDASVHLTRMSNRLIGTKVEMTTPAGFGMQMHDDEDHDGDLPRPVAGQYFDQNYPGQTFDKMTENPFVNADLPKKKYGPGDIYHKFSSTYTRRFEFYSSQNSSQTDVHRVIIQTFLGTQLTLGNMKKLIRCDVPFPFGFVCFRPYMTYRMGSAILAVKGRTTGETLIGHANFQLGDDPVQKMHIGNFTLYEKSVVYKPHQVGIAENIFSMGYLYGNDCNFYSGRDQLGGGTPGTMNASIFSCLVPYEGTGSEDVMQTKNEFPNPMSITGQFEHTILAAMQTQEQKDTPHYPSAGFYKNFWRWVSPADPDHSERMYDVSATLNTICYQGHQQNYNPSTGQYDIVIANTGHWGDKIYPGCGKVRRGVEKMLQSVTYAGSVTPYPNATHLDY